MGVATGRRMGEGGGDAYEEASSASESCSSCSRPRRDGTGRDLTGEAIGVALVSVTVVTLPSSVVVVVLVLMMYATVMQGSANDL